MQKLLIDIGSSTVKVYRVDNLDVELLETKSFHFKAHFNLQTGLEDEVLESLLRYVRDVTERYDFEETKAYATAVFRKLAPTIQEKLGKEFYQATKVPFTVVSHERENHYLQKAIATEAIQTPILLVNVGGGSTEIVIVDNNEAMERHNFTIGISTILEDFPRLNDVYAGHSLQEVVAYVQKVLPSKRQPIDLAVYNGGELTYMKLVDYALQKNEFFEDSFHPAMISASDVISQNKRVFEEFSLLSLEAKMPQDPRWMHGARACSAISQAVMEHFGVQYVIPSDTNMIHGIVRADAGL